MTIVVAPDLTTEQTRTAPKVEIGDYILRTETERYIQGAGNYVDDRQLPGMLHCAFVRSTTPHAHIASIDIERARALPGVEFVMTGSQAEEELHPLANRWPLVSDRVRFVGEPVAVVVAKDRYIAEDAVELVEVVYDPLPAVADALLALEDGAPLLYPQMESNCVYERRFSSLGFEKAMAAAPVIVEVQTRSARAAAAPMEPRSYAAAWNASTQSLTVWTCASNPFAVSKDIAISLGMPETRVRVEVDDVGGSFGAKNAVYPEEIIVAYLARAIDAPVKYTETRTEHFHATTQGRDQRHSLRAAFSRDGKILAIEDEIIADMGATSHADNSIDAAANNLPGPYKLPEYRFRSRGVATNKTPHGSLRGIGKADAAFAIERLMDQAARKLDIDRAEIRLRNFVPPSDFPYRTPTGAFLDSGRYGDTLRKAMEIADYGALLAERERLRKEGIHRGVGVTLVLEPTSASRGFTGMGGGMGFAMCRVTITPTGQILVHSGGPQQGQGHQTSLAQIVADRLDVPMSSVNVILSDTHATPHGFQTASSRSTTVVMSAAYLAGDLAAQKARAIAAYRWGIAIDDVQLVDSGVTGPDGHRMTLAEIAYLAYIRIDLIPPDMEPGFEILGTFRNPNINFEPDEQGRYNSFSSYPYDACVCVVDVDMETGVPSLRKYVTVHDCGNPLNPIIVDTQHVGATVQGIGLALLEEITYGDDGVPLTSGFMDYLLPSVNELPEEFVTDHTVTPSPFTPHGAKGGGETGTLSPPVAFASAIEDAIGATDVVLTRMPFTSERIYAAIGEVKTT